MVGVVRWAFLLEHACNLVVGDRVFAGRRNRLSTLTKVFVVLLVVFSIAFTTMTVSIVANTADWRDTALRYEQHARVADTNLQNLMAANSAELAAAHNTVRGHVARIGDLETQLQESAGEVASIKAERARLVSEKSSAEAVNRGLVAQLQSTDAARVQYQTQRDELETRNIGIERRNIELDDRVNELTAQVAVMIEQKRQFEQQIHILRSENAKLAIGSRQRSSALAMEDPSGAAMSNVVAHTPVSATPIRGHVADVSGDIITITVGSSDGVRKDMIFVVHRDGEYVGDLKINMVDSDSAAGRALGAPFTPRRGDQITDAVGISSLRG